MKKFAYQHQEVDETAKLCSNSDCGNIAEFPAPKRYQLNSIFNTKQQHHSIPGEELPPERDWYCSDCIKEFNANWDFFSGMDEEKIELFQRDAVTGHRNTWKIGARESHRYNLWTTNAYKTAHRFREGNTDEKEPNASMPKNEREAMHVLGLSYPLTINKLKARYRILVKRFHPDHNNDACEEKIKAINHAYTTLKSVVS